ncbi:uncharacterized protein LOC126657263 [Mercurialis annua]|uniref:uncharacterized protein LOC126657263 n=1 Tax=Mercurialis annua TaxID=3986 RepID=UPI0024AE5186|nr:uncharacterized protein LOC126657263 [Mercurialis annua]
MRGGRKEKKRDDDLLLFKELRKREKDHLANLLHPLVSEDFEPNTARSYALNKMNNASRYDFSGENLDKNDYDWLKTPPATPLFPSLEMEAANAPQLVLQREIPILPQQPLSRFAITTSTEALKGTSSGSKVKPVTSQTKLNLKSNNPTQNHKQPQKLNTITSHSKPTPTTNHPVKSTPSFSNPPSNLRTNRANSATRARPSVVPTKVPSPPIHKNTSSPRTNGTNRPTSAPGRPAVVVPSPPIHQNTSSPRTNATQLFGSRMADKIVTARKLGGRDREPKPKPLHSLR